MGALKIAMIRLITCLWLWAGIICGTTIPTRLQEFYVGTKQVSFSSVLCTAQSDLGLLQIQMTILLNGQLIHMLWGGRGKKWRHRGAWWGKSTTPFYLGQRRIVCDHPCTHNPPWLYPRIHCQIYLILFYKWRNIKLKNKDFSFYI